MLECYVGTQPFFPHSLARSQVVAVAVAAEEAAVGGEGGAPAALADRGEAGDAEAAGRGDARQDAGGGRGRRRHRPLQRAGAGAERRRHRR